MRSGIVGIQGEAFAQGALGAVPVPLARQDMTEAAVRLGLLRDERNRGTSRGDGLIDAVRTVVGDREGELRTISG